MALVNYQASLTGTPTTVISAVVGANVILLNALAANTHPSATASIDIIKRGTGDLYLVSGLQIPAGNSIALPLGKLVLETGESIVARAYGIPVVNWDVVDWDTLDWNNLTYTTSSSPIDLHFSVST